MLKKLIVLLLSLAAAVTLVACGDANKPADNQDGGKIKVSVTFNAMKEFVQAVGKDRVEISAIVPDGSSAHGFEPKAQDLVKLSTAQLFVYNGLGMDAWAEEAAASSNNPGLILVDSSSGADLIVREEGEDDHDEDDHDEDGHSEDEHEEDDHDHGMYDPHLWLGLKGAQTQAANIRDALALADPDNKEYYEQNCADFVSQLEELYNEYGEKFRSLDKSSFVTGHAAFGYLCRDLGLTQNSVRDIYADGEPSAQQLTELVKYCRDNDVTTIFAEEMASPAVSRTLADEVKAKVETIFTIESGEDGRTYLERMSDNLKRIYDSLS